jgi:hypothetical protein
LASPEMDGQQLTTRPKMALAHWAIQLSKPRTCLDPVYRSAAP